MHYPKIVTLLIVITEFVSAFHKFDINRLLLRINRSQFNITNIREHWMNQPLDHYDKSDTRTFRMRYFENDSLWKQNGPVFIFICGEHELNSNWIAKSSATLIGQLAEDTNGAMFAPEHRYYGNSFHSNTNDLNYYKFLSSRQALADFEKFVEIKIKSQPKYEKSKVVVIGGSYGGNLAAWLRKLNPHLVDAAVASSAPVRAKADFSEYLDILCDTLRKYGTEGCMHKLKKIYNSYKNLLTSAIGIKKLKKKFNICKNSDLEAPENQQYFIYLQNIKLMTKFTEIRTPNDVKDMCKNIESIFEPSRNMPCTNIDYSSAKYETPWFYQLCKEFGYFQTTSSDGSKNIFGNWNPLEFYLHFCKYLIKGFTTENMLNRIKATNRRYGGRNLKVEKVVFTYGDMDPWSKLGVKETDGYHVKIIKRTSHCAVLSQYGDEPKELTKHREHVKKLIKRWITRRKYEDFRLDSNLTRPNSGTIRYL